MKTEQNLDNCTEQALTIPAVGGVRVCTCEMPAKMKGKNQCWRCKKPFKEFLQTDCQRGIYECFKMNNN